MKIAKIILLALTTCLTSCYEDYTYDYETTNVGFALQNPLRTVISDRDMPIYVGVSLGGKREVDMNDWAIFTLDASLLEGTPLTLLPESDYTLCPPFQSHRKFHEHYSRGSGLFYCSNKVCQFLFRSLLPSR